MGKKQGLFLDRDGVINKDLNYVHLIKDFEFIDGVFEAIKLYVAGGYMPIIITNQSGIGRGYYTQEQFDELTEWMLKEFAKQNIKIAKVYFCPHDPDDSCDCRKPLPKMIHDGAQEFDLDLENSILVGDKESDIDAGIAAGIKTSFLISDKPGVATKATFTVNRLLDTIDILQRKGRL